MRKLASMQAPNTPEGQLTELIAARIRQKLPDLPKHYCNPIWSAILETLQEHLPRTRKMTEPMGRDEFLKLIGPRVAAHGYR